MKKALFLIINILIMSFISMQQAFAYQTVIVDFPPNQGWHSVYYDTQGTEAILQYVPVGQTYESWTKTVIFHAYKGVNYSAAGLANRLTQQMELQNPTQLYTFTKFTDADAIAYRYIKTNPRISAQGEVFRVTKGPDGLISMHYINKNISDYKNSFNTWYEIIKNVTIYYSYYMDERFMNKATSFEL